MIFSTGFVSKLSMLVLRVRQWQGRLGSLDTRLQIVIVDAFLFPSYRTEPRPFGIGEGDRQPFGYDAQSIEQHAK